MGGEWKFLAPRVRQGVTELSGAATGCGVRMEGGPFPRAKGPRQLWGTLSKNPTSSRDQDDSTIRGAVPSWEAPHH